MDLINFNIIKEEAEKDLKVTKENLTESSMTSGLLTCKYLNFHRDYIIALNKAIKYKDQLKILLYLYFTGKATAEQIKSLGYDKPFSLKIDKVADIDMFILGSPKYVEADNSIVDFKEIIKYLESIIDNLKFRHLSIQNVINWEKFKNGL